ncbi:MAG: calcium/proton exchanger Cax [Chthonomonadaceae bacterium]|nr:calcium/proton exchanger Cax [Chthonomonadaceae bacterium]
MRWMLAMLIFVPISFILHFMHMAEGWVFLASSLAIVPLAGFMGTATEELAKCLGPGIGGLLNATFGNATELIICIVAVQSGQIAVVKASMIGSIIGNVLLVLGLSVLVGGVKHKMQIFNKDVAQSHATMLALAVIGLLVPALFVRESGITETASNPHITALSMGVAGVLMVLYVGSLVFSLRTHENLFRGGEEEGHDPPEWSRVKAMTVLLVCTIFVAIESELLVHSIEPVIAQWHIGKIFLGVILLPIIGNAAEHSTAVMMAAKNKMDISFNIAISSSTQIAMFVIPLIIFVSPLMGHPVTILFSNYELIAISSATAIGVLISMDGKSHWLEGAQLLAVYVIVGLAFYFIAQ